MLFKFNASIRLHKAKKRLFSNLYGRRHLHILLWSPISPEECKPTSLETAIPELLRKLSSWVCFVIWHSVWGHDIVKVLRWVHGVKGGRSEGACLNHNGSFLHRVELSWDPCPSMFHSRLPFRSLFDIWVLECALWFVPAFGDIIPMGKDLNRDRLDAESCCCG